MGQRYVSSKWTKTAVLLKNNELSHYVPETRRMNRQSLKLMLDRYGMVYIKPDRGTFGIGVMRVTKSHKNGKSTYSYQFNTQIRKFSSFMPMYSSIKKRTKRRKYLVQKGIRLLRYKKRRFDLRIMVQRSPEKKWETTGIIARVAAPKKIVTNYHNGGTPTDVNRVLSHHIHGQNRSAYLEKLKDLGVKVGQQYQLKYPEFREVGVDVGLDSSMKPWIFEVNTRPDRYIFRKLKDKSMFRKVMRYARAHSR